MFHRQSQQKLLKQQFLKTTVPETTVPENCVPETTVPETTEEVPAGALTVNATSNLFPASSNVVAGDKEKVKENLYIESEKNVLNADFNLTYDPNNKLL